MCIYVKRQGGERARIHLFLYISSTHLSSRRGQRRRGGSRRGNGWLGKAWQGGRLLLYSPWWLEFWSMWKYFPFQKRHEIKSLRAHFTDRETLRTSRFAGSSPTKPRLEEGGEMEMSSWGAASLVSWVNPHSSLPAFQMWTLGLRAGGWHSELTGRGAGVAHIQVTFSALGAPVSPCHRKMLPLAGPQAWWISHFTGASQSSYPELSVIWPKRIIVCLN